MRSGEQLPTEHERSVVDLSAFTAGDLVQLHDALSAPGAELLAAHFAPALDALPENNVELTHEFCAALVASEDERRHLTAAKLVPRLSEQNKDAAKAAVGLMRMLLEKSTPAVRITVSDALHQSTARVIRHPDYYDGDWPRLYNVWHEYRAAQRARPGYYDPNVVWAEMLTRTFPEEFRERG